MLRSILGIRLDHLRIRWLQVLAPWRLDLHDGIVRSRRLAIDTGLGVSVHGGSGDGMCLFVDDG